MAFVKFLLAKFNDFTIYTPKDNSTEGALIYSIYKKEEDEAPVFYYIIEGLPSFKVWSVLSIFFKSKHILQTVFFLMLNEEKCKIT